jgi:hypothetical protein
MKDRLTVLLQVADLQTPLFPRNSRYHGLATSQRTAPDGRVVTYLKRRFVPSTERFAPLQEHVVRQGDRLDNLANTYLGDPEQYWRLCDANGVLRPTELEEIGRRVVITLPEGLPGASDA